MTNQVNPTQSSASGSKKSTVVDESLILELRNNAFNKRPKLQEIYQNHGNKTLYEYAKSYNDHYGKNIKESLKNECISAITDEISRLLGDEVATSCKTQLLTTYRITTTDHHGPLSEPGMVNGNIHEALPYLEGDSIFKNIIVLGCGNISFDNESFPRGLLLHTTHEDELEINQLVFFPRAVRPRPVIFFQAYDTSNIQKATNLIDAWQKSGSLDKKNAEGLQQLIQEVYSDEKILKSSLFSDQVTQTNYKLWNKILRQYPKAPKLVYIEQEKIVLNLLRKHHIDSDTFIHELLFNATYQEKLLTYFDGIDKAFSTVEKKGTYLFWALPPGQKYRVQLWKEGDVLRNEDGSYEVPLTPSRIKEAIDRNELIPSTLLSFLLLAFYYGIKLTGGSNQTTYLSQMKVALINLLEDVGNNDQSQFVHAVPTTEMSIALHCLAFIKSSKSTVMHPATGIDLVLHASESTLMDLQKEAQQITVSEAIDWNLADAYKWYYPEHEREVKLVSINKNDIGSYLGTINRIHPIQYEI
jgi:hypothetical protein